MTTASNFKNLTLDARPDRLDLRDREYRPHLKSLPSAYPDLRGTWTSLESLLECYADSQLILDQGKEGACTGFGLAATINYLIWRDTIAEIHSSLDGKDHCIDIRGQRVSERMLYQMARVYDEWDGEDYSGSSCRGAMKGWHRHGVCRKSFWPYALDGTFLKPEPGWEVDALANPLGAYYRVNHKSVVDMQSALTEAGALYCSASTHDGWHIEGAARMPVLQYSQESVASGGHAFCIVGYNKTGFMVQNSWGKKWGWKGFAIISYQDWISNGYDAWVVARGVPVDSINAPTMYSNSSLRALTNQEAVKSESTKRKSKTEPWVESRAYQHSLVLSNNGRPRHTVLHAENADASAQEICYDNLKTWLDSSTANRKIMIYAHGGLNDEKTAIARVSAMAPYFHENEIYPLYIVWKTGLGEILRNTLADAYKNIVPTAAASSIKDWVADRTDTAIEAASRALHVKSIWTEIKENARHASDRRVPGYSLGKTDKAGGMVILAKCLSDLNELYPDIEVHVVGHSAGAILIGEWFREVIKRKLKLSSVTLFAPACTIEFANKTYKRAVEKDVLKINDINIVNLDDEMERNDRSLIVYQKSLLYLVSRALEDLHKTPLLGLAAAWHAKNCKAKESGGFHVSQRREIASWSDFFGKANKPILLGRRRGQVKISTKPTYIDLNHGSFDNDITVIENVIRQIRGAKLRHKVSDLSGY
jgi:hypothetical protein